MSEARAASARERGERRRAQTRTALVRAAQQLLAEDRTAVPVLEITQLADVGMGSFYNHFSSKEELFTAAVDDALELQGALLDAATEGFEDPAEAFAHSFRVVGRVHRVQPRLSRVLLSRGPELIAADRGLAPRARRDIAAAIEAGRFTLADADIGLLVAGGTAMTLGQALHDDPTIDDAAYTDRVTRELLVMFGLAPAEADRICALPLPDVASGAHLDD
ncbi:TetR/AcrR family transcriptional regulator [Nocardioides fonticola]|uniref:TetR/AcrR family transcriptional regulator n=1 Tax=Nocardioides fonticola TaxID=450363 RepID=A0ABP7XKX5_9ACTN